MYLTLHLLAAHFIADYPLQSNSLIEFKRKKFIGVILHSLVHLATSALLILPFLSYRVMWSITAIFIAHIIIDEIKGMLCKYTKLNNQFLYVADQAAHVLIVYIVAVYFIGKTNIQTSQFLSVLYENKSIISFILALTLTTYFYDVSKWTLLPAKKSQHYKRDYNMMFRNGIIVVIAFVTYWII